MGTRIFVQGIHTEAHPTKGADGYAVMNDGMRRVYETVLRPDTEVAMHFVPRTTFMTNHAYLALLNNAELVRGVIDADRNIRHFGLTDKAIAHRPARTPVGPAWVDLVREGVTWFESPDFVHERV
ncbi:MAG: hypothetical protein MUE34_15725, partial [Acidimicrobiales bacterium]|nr:hypothetical protein [Acidimicrobiales bacterium]